MQNMNDPQDSENFAQIKQEDDCEMMQQIGAGIDDESMHLSSQKIHLTPRVIKRPNSAAIAAGVMGRDHDGGQNSFVAPPLLSLLRSTVSATSDTDANYGREQCQEPFQQRVHVIKDGRYYGESHHTDGAHTQSLHREQSPPLPPLLPVQQPTDGLLKRGGASDTSAMNRQVIVNTCNGKSTNESRDSASVNVVFRPPVVSSSCQPMRPPPPPPPPKSKINASEEPSSSIPDLGEYPFILTFLTFLWLTFFFCCCCIENKNLPDRICLWLLYQNREIHIKWMENIQKSTWLFGCCLSGFCLFFFFF